MSALHLAVHTTPEPLPTPEQTPALAWRITDVARALNVSEKTIHRWALSGKFPRPDRVVNRTPLWRPSTVETWLNEGGKRK